MILYSLCICRQSRREKGRADSDTAPSGAQGSQGPTRLGLSLHAKAATRGTRSSRLGSFGPIRSESRVTPSESWWGTGTDQGWPNHGQSMLDQPESGDSDQQWSWRSASIHIRVNLGERGRADRQPAPRNPPLPAARTPPLTVSFRETRTCTRAGTQFHTL